MAGTSTIVIVRSDLSIAGAEENPKNSRSKRDIERQFFDLTREKRPDVVVFDLRAAAGDGLDAIARVRKCSDIPILVICDTDDPLVREYRLAGAADVLPAPTDIVTLNRTVQEITSMSGGRLADAVPAAELIAVAGMMFRPYENRLTVNGSSIKLTTAENRLLCHLVSRSRTVCSREEIAEIVYGRYRPTSERAVDVIVTRLRKKLAELRGIAAQDLIKTEFRQGYMFVGAVSAARESARLEAEAV
jgi:two-component system, OmpR family, response regulator